MKITAVCVTYNRPKLLGRMIHCFQQQDYPDCELVILDDAGQYGREITFGPKWRLYSQPNRYPTLGEKRNAAASLASRFSDAIAVWDDDDIYLPWALSATVAAIQRSDLSRPSIVLHPDAGGQLHQHATGGLFHSGWGYRRELFERIGGYTAMDNGEDQNFLCRAIAAGAVTTDPLALGHRPFMCYPWEQEFDRRPQLSYAGREGYRHFSMMEIQKTKIEQWIAAPTPIDLKNPAILPGVKPRKF